MGCPAIGRSGQWAVVLGWLKGLPSELVHCRPVLCVWYAGALLAGGKLEAVEDRLQIAGETAGVYATGMRDRPEAPLGKMVVVDEEEFRRLPGSIAVFRAAGPGPPAMRPPP